MPLLWLSLAFFVGIVLADFFSLPTITWLILSGVSLGLAVVVVILRRLRTRRFYMQKSLPLLISLSPLSLLALTMGGLRYQASLPDLSDPTFIAYYNDSGERVSLTGAVVSFPNLRDNYLYLRIQSEDIRPYGTITQHTAAQGLVLVRLDPERVFHYGDRLLLHGFLETPPRS